MTINLEGFTREQRRTVRRLLSAQRRYLIRALRGAIDRIAETLEDDAAPLCRECALPRVDDDGDLCHACAQHEYQDADNAPTRKEGTG